MGRGEEEGDTRDHGASGAQVWGKMSSVAARRAASSQHRSVVGSFRGVAAAAAVSHPALVSASQLTPGYMPQLYLFPYTDTLPLVRAQFNKDPNPVRQGSEQAVPNPEIDWVYKLSVTNSSIMAVVTSRQTVCSVP